MKSLKAIVLLFVVLMTCLSFAACGGPKSAAVLKVEKGLDDLKMGIEANPTDCAKMAGAIKAPVNDVVAGVKETKEKGEKLPAGTKMKFAGLTTTFGKIGPCSKTPEMQQLVQSLMASATMQ